MEVADLLLGFPKDIVRKYNEESRLLYLLCAIEQSVREQMNNGNTYSRLLHVIWLKQNICAKCVVSLY
jgi:hypothetical protein